MSNGFDLGKALRILKSKKITKEQVAKVTTVTPGYISKMLSGAKPISESFLDVFLREFGKDLEGEMLVEVSDNQTAIKIFALEEKVELLTHVALGLLAHIKGNNSVKNITGVDLSGLIKEFDEILEDRVKRRFEKQ